MVTGLSPPGLAAGPPIDHCARVVDALLQGRVVPFLGAGVNLSARPKDAAFQPGKDLPSGGELTDYLAEKFKYPAGGPRDLMRVSQYAALMEGTFPLYEKLRDLFDADYPSTTVHDFLAALPGVLRAKKLPPRPQLIVTTNYDDVLERAFRAADGGKGEPFDVVAYEAEGGARGKFWHEPHGGKAVLIQSPNDYAGLPVDERMKLQRTIIFKIHGAVNRKDPDPEKSSFVITEDDYIQYLALMDSSNPLPKVLAAAMKNRSFLFLGYSLRDFNLRVILYRIWGEQKLTTNSWAVLLNLDALDQKLWQKREVEIVVSLLDVYVAALKDQLDGRLPGP